MPHHPMKRHRQRNQGLGQRAQRCDGRGLDAGGSTKSAPLHLESERLALGMIAKDLLLHADTFGMRMSWTPRRLAIAVLAGRVFFIESRGVPYFPSFFADPRNDPRRVGDICCLLRGMPGGAIFQFFVNARGSLAGQTPLEALRGGRIAKVKDLANAFMEG